MSRLARSWVDYICRRHVAIIVLVRNASDKEKPRRAGSHLCVDPALKHQCDAGLSSVHETTCCEVCAAKCEPAVASCTSFASCCLNSCGCLRSEAGCPSELRHCRASYVSLATSPRLGFHFVVGGIGCFVDEPDDGSDANDATPGRPNKAVRGPNCVEGAGVEAAALADHSPREPYVHLACADRGPGIGRSAIGSRSCERGGHKRVSAYCGGRRGADRELICVSWLVLAAAGHREGIATVSPTFARVGSNRRVANDRPTRRRPA
jgi:hypothetical protein